MTRDRRVLTLSGAISLWCKHLEARRLSPLTIRDYMSCMVVVEKVLGSDIEASTLTIEDGENVISSILDFVSASTVAKYVSVWRSFSAWGRKRHGWYDWACDIDRPRKSTPEYRRLTTPEVAAMLRANIDERRSTMVWIFAYTGIRISEARSLRWGHVDLDEGTLIVELGKGRKGRTVAIAPVLADHLRVVRAQRANLYGDESVASSAYVHYYEWTHQVPGETNPHTTRDFGRPVGLQMLWRAVKLAAKRGAVRDPDTVSTHMFRRHLLEHSAAQGTSMNTLQSIAGHASIQTTSLYTGRAKLETMRAAVENIDFGEFRAAGDGSHGAGAAAPSDAAPVTGRPHFVTPLEADIVTPDRTKSSDRGERAMGIEPTYAGTTRNSASGREPLDEEEAGW